jgi:hypothetical protein
MIDTKATAIGKECIPPNSHLVLGVIGFFFCIQRSVVSNPNNSSNHTTKTSPITMCTVVNNLK